MEHRAKSYACFTEGNSSYGFERHNLADKAAAARAKLPYCPTLNHTEQSFSVIEQPRAKYPWCMQHGYRQMKSRRAAMQGENTRRLATYLGLARREFTQGG